MALVASTPLSRKGPSGPSPTAARVTEHVRRSGAAARIIKSAALVVPVYQVVGHEHIVAFGVGRGVKVIPPFHPDHIRIGHLLVGEQGVAIDFMAGSARASRGRGFG